MGAVACVAIASSSAAVADATPLKVKTTLKIKLRASGEARVTERLKKKNAHFCLNRFVTVVRNGTSTQYLIPDFHYDSRKKIHFDVPYTPGDQLSAKVRRATFKKGTTNLNRKLVCGAASARL